MHTDHPILEDINVQQILKMFDLIPNIMFWIKDKESRLIYVNKLFCDHFGISQMDYVQGKTDYDLSPPHIAKQFINDDKKVVQGEAVTDRWELNIDAEGHIAWFSTSKRPLKNSSDEIIGSYGITRHLQNASRELSDIEAISAPIKYIRANFSTEIKVQELAEVAHLSISALERRFKKYLSKTPKQVINQVRLEHARKLLIETDLPIAEIAFNCGFSDHSHFSKQFKLLFDELPSDSRNQGRMNKL